MSKLVNTISWEEKDDILHITPLGDSISFRQTDFVYDLERIRNYITENQTTKILVDLGAANYFGSIVIGGINTLALEAKKHGGTLVVGSASETMVEVLKHMNLDSVFPMFADKNDALKVLKAWK